MPVPNTMQDLFTLASSNSPAGTEAIGNSLDNYIRAQAAILRSTNALASATIAAASTTDIATADAESVQVTGTASITSLGTGFNGCRREVRFSSTPTLVHSANLVLPGASNITVSAGECIVFRCVGSGQWVLVDRSFGYVPLPTVSPVVTTTLTINAANASSMNVYSDTAGEIVMEAYSTATPATKYTFNIAKYGGALKVGGQITASSNIVSTGGRLQVVSTAESTTGNFVLATGSAGTVYLRPNGSGSVSGEAQVQSSGNFVISGTGTGVNWIATSDRDLKEAIESAQADLYLADRLRFVEFDWKASGQHDYGVIAQEVREIAHRYVHTGADGRLAVDKSSLALEAVIGLAERVRKLEAA